MYNIFPIVNIVSQLHEYESYLNMNIVDLQSDDIKLKELYLNMDRVIVEHGGFELFKFYLFIYFYFLFLIYFLFIQ